MKMYKIKKKMTFKEFQEKNLEALNEKFFSRFGGSFREDQNEFETLEYELAQNKIRKISQTRPSELIIKKGVVEGNGVIVGEYSFLFINTK